MYDFDLALESDLETVWNSAFLNKEFKVSWKSLKMCCQKRFLKVITVSLMVNKEYCPILSRIMFVPLLRYRPLWRKWLISLFYMQIMQHDDATMMIHATIILRGLSHFITQFSFLFDCQSIARYQREWYVWTNVCNRSGVDFLSKVSPEVNRRWLFLSMCIMSINHSVSTQP